MKKFSFLGLALTSLLFGACSFEGDEYITIGTGIENFDIVVSYKDWQPNAQIGTPEYFLYADVKMPELTPSVINNDAIVVYLMENNNTVATPLPITNTFTRYNGRLVTETLGFTLSPGWIRFTLDDSDLMTEPYSYNIKIRMVIVYDNSKN